MKLKKIKTIEDVHAYAGAQLTNKAREQAWAQGIAKLAKIEAAKKAVKMPEELKINSTKSANTTHTENNLVAMVERIDHDTIDHDARILDLEQKIIWLEACVNKLMTQEVAHVQCEHSYYTNKNSCAGCDWGSSECTGDKS